ncbi:phosphoribosylglycinamide formyltransferase [bacterium]|jgi:phosphoribosylglycinamide formyltransferase-1|nr:phosphoribosylglycinamide formyltransferase [bacterium]
MSSIPIAVFASGRGTNFEAILKATQNQKLNAKIVALVCDKKGAPVLAKAKAAGIPVLEIVPTKETTREQHDQNVLEALKPYSPKFLVMTGYMRIVTSKLLEAFRSPRKYTRVVNVHPSLLPAFPGVAGYAQAFAHGNKVAGVTVHLVEQEVDSGPICAQEAFSIADCKTAEEVEKRGLEVEHRLFAETLKWVLPEKFEVEERELKSHRRFCVRQS